jgi:uroporphyrinogen decarboxylase
MSKTTFDKRERVEAALSGQTPDRVPVSAWGHLLPAETDIDSLAEASLAFFREYDWDWLKVNPRASYFAEAWGSEFDLDEYHGVLPRFVRNRHDPFDPARLEAVKPSVPVWAGHLRLLRKIKAGLGGAPFVQTIFSPASVLAYLAGRPSDHSQAAAATNHAETLLHLARTRPAAVHHALGVIADSLAALAVESLNAGADGIFFAITKLARSGGFTPEEFIEFGKPYDRRVLEAVGQARFNILHLCGSDAYWQSVQDYPVRAINWASVGQGNPDLAAARQSSQLALIGGVDETAVLQKGTPDQVRAAVRQALVLGGQHKYLLAPGCCIEPGTPKANIRAFRDAAN